MTSPQDRVQGFVQDLARNFGSGEGDQLANQHRGQLQARPHESDRNASAVVLAFVVFGLGFVGLIGWSVARNRDGSGTYLSPSIEYLLPVAGVVFGALAVWQWRKFWKVADKPVVEIAGAAPGRSEVVGKPVTSAPQTSWFTNTPCVFWSAKVEVRSSGKNNKNKWRTVWSQHQGSQKFWLEDVSGRLAIDIANASGDAANGRRLVQERIGRYRYTEHAVTLADDVWVSGPVNLAANGTLWMGEPPDGKNFSFKDQMYVAFSEQRFARGRRNTAIAFTLISLFLAAITPIWTTTTSTVKDHVGDTTLVLKDDISWRPVLAIVIAGLLLYVVSYFIRLYNRLAELRQQAIYAWSNIDVAAKTRHDLVGQLQTAAAASAHYEREVLLRHVELRAGLPEDDEVAAVTSTIAEDNRARAVLARSEAYPELQSNQAYKALFDGLVGTENRLSAARRFYNDAVTVLADRSQTYPGRLFVPLTLHRGAPPLLDLDVAR